MDINNIKEKFYKETYLIKSKDKWLEGKIDKQDFDLILNYVWNLHTGGYAQCSCLRDNKKERFLHRVIAKRMGINAEQIDHINGDKLDNRRCNLRGATNQQNSMNRKKQNNNTTGFKGVYEDKRMGIKTRKWIAQVRLNNKHIFKEGFYTPEEAARAYDLMALKYFGEYSNLNFPRTDYITPVSTDT